MDLLHNNIFEQVLYGITITVTLYITLIYFTFLFVLKVVNQSSLAQPFTATNLTYIQPISLRFQTELPY